MRKRVLFRVFSLVMITLLVAFAFVACEESSGEKSLVDIDVINLPEDGIYAGKFDEADIQLKLIYDDDSTEIVHLTEADIPDEYKVLIRTPGEHTIEMLYKGIEVSYSLKVKNAECTITFVNFNDEVVKTIKYNFIDKTPEIVPPTAEEMAVEGYVFTGEFDKSLEGITEDTTIKGIYSESCTVKFLNFFGEVVSEQSVVAGGSAVAPSAEKMAVAGYRFTGDFN
jgi:hypothetical protein